MRSVGVLWVVERSRQAERAYPRSSEVTPTDPAGLPGATCRYPTRWKKDDDCGATPIGLLITPDDRTAFVANTGSDLVIVVDLTTWEVVDRIVTGQAPDGMAWVP